MRASQTPNNDFLLPMIKTRQRDSWRVWHILGFMSAPCVDDRLDTRLRVELRNIRQTVAKLRNHAQLLSHISILTIGCHRSSAAPDMSNKLRNRAFVGLILVNGVDESMPQRMERFLTVTGKTEDFAKVVFVKPF